MGQGWGHLALPNVNLVIRQSKRGNRWEKEEFSRRTERGGKGELKQRPVIDPGKVSTEEKES